MEYKVKITPKALEQAERAYLWILKQSASREIANKWFTELIKATDTLALHPARWKRILVQKTKMAIW